MEFIDEKFRIYALFCLIFNYTNESGAGIGPGLGFDGGFWFYAIPLQDLVYADLIRSNLFL